MCNNGELTPIGEQIEKLMQYLVEQSERKTKNESGNK